MQLTDTRTLTREALTVLHGRYAKLRCLIATAEARLNNAINDLTAKSLAATADVRAEAEGVNAAITNGILSHPDWFVKPRTIRDAYGKLGLRAASNKLFCEDKPAALAWARENGYTDCIRTEEVLDVEALKTRMRAGEQPPGCRLPEGDIAFVDVDEKLLEAATTLVVVDPPQAEG